MKPSCTLPCTQPVYTDEASDDLIEALKDYKCNVIQNPDYEHTAEHKNPRMYTRRFITESVHPVGWSTTVFLKCQVDSHWTLALSCAGEW